MLQFEAAHFCPNLVRTRPKPTTWRTIRAVPKGSGRAVMACLLPGVSSAELLLKTELAARDLGGELFAVCVSPPRGFFSRSTTTLDSDLTYASSFGAKTVRLVSRDVTGAFLDFALKAGVSRIFVTRTPPPPFYKFFFTSTYCELLRRAKGLRIEVVGLALQP
jgi:K+-sensing histidine kinase KdpD